MTMSSELKDFVKKVITIKGGMAELKREDEERLNILLPSELQKKLSLKEYETVTFSSELPGKLVTYGSPFLDKITFLTENIGWLASIKLKELSLKRTGLSVLVDNKFEFINVKKRGYSFRGEVLCSYLLVNFRATIISDERREELISVAIDEQTLRAFPNSNSLLSSFLHQPVEEPVSVLERYPLDEIMEKARKEAKAGLECDLEGWEKSYLRRLRRDVERLWDYYQELKKQLRRRMGREYLTGEEKENLVSKIKATDQEFQRKVNDLKDKYSLRINFQPLNACRVYVPKVMTECEVQRKSRTRKLLFFWNPLLRDAEPLEPLLCEACGAETYGIFLCDDLHLLCSHCHFSCPQCGKKICRQCFPERCPNCDTWWK